MIANYTITKDKNIEDALEKLNQNLGVGLMVVDENMALLGSVTDGDIRRAITAGLSLETSITKVMFQKPITANKETTLEELNEITRGSRIKLVPILKENIVVDVFTVDLDETKDIPVVLMAGGLGSRLGDLTKDCPKPMLEVGGRPVLQRIIENFTRVGFRKFYISVNYKADVIEDYFGNGEKFNCKITYLKEKERLGTAGSLSLLTPTLNGPIVVTNGDLLTLVDYRMLISFHKEQDSKISMCTRLFELQVPYGVVNIDNGRAKSMEEKPVHSFNVNAGVYVLDGSLLPNIEKEKYLDMPTFIEAEMHEHEVHCFPMIEKWIDIGKVSDLEYARNLYGDSND